MRAQRWWAWPLVPVYAAVVAAKDWLRRVGGLRVRRLRWPVVSVGSLSAGGAGKTPVVIALATMLMEHEWVVDVLSHGYGRSGTGAERVEPERADAAERFGDEPVVMARAGIAVWVGEDRFVAGQKAESWSGDGMEDSRLLPQTMPTLAAKDAAKMGHPEGRRGVHVLDDGFQHRGLARDLDVVLVTARELEDVLLPAGDMREGLGALRRADVVVVREEELEAVREKVWPLMREGAQMWLIRRQLRFPAPLFSLGAGLRPVAFCGIARPEGFQAMLLEAGCGVVETVAFPDHHPYAMADVERIIEVARGLGATGFVTTEKDAVKLTGEMRARLEDFGPVMIVVLESIFVDRSAVFGTLESRLRARVGGGTA